MSVSYGTVRRGVAKTDRDFAMALKLHEELNGGSRDLQSTSSSTKTNQTDQMNLGDPDLEFSDPTPDVYAMFLQFNKLFFDNTLSSVAVRWSKRMYQCAGICRFQTKTGFCDIALSEPLLKLRPRKNLIETLLHEMIHAYLFIFEKDRDREHGPNFVKHMNRINKEANLNITIYHNFSDEVNLYKTHIWRCDGPCQKFKPFFGIVRRTCNRAPGPSDRWWQRHRALCNGSFIKIGEPEKKKPIKQNKNQAKPNINNKDIKKYFTDPSRINNKSVNDNTVEQIPKKIKLENENKRIKPKDEFIKPSIPIEKKPKIEPKLKTSINGESNNNVRDTVRNHWSNKYLDIDTKISKDETNKTVIDSDNFNSVIKDKRAKFPTISDKTVLKDDCDAILKCPICNEGIEDSSLVNNHIDNCLNTVNFDSQSPKIVDLTEDLSDNKSKINKYDSENLESLSNCPICEKQIRKTQFQEHIEDCLNTSFGCEESDSQPSVSHDSSIICISDDDYITEEDNFENDNVLNDIVDCMPCPCCLNLIKQSEIHNHLNSCLSDLVL